MLIWLFNKHKKKKNSRKISPIQEKFVPGKINIYKVFAGYIKIHSKRRARRALSFGMLLSFRGALHHGDDDHSRLTDGYGITH
jgi:hypothetical protein